MNGKRSNRRGWTGSSSWPWLIRGNITQITGQPWQFANHAKLWNCRHLAGLRMALWLSLSLCVWNCRPIYRCFSHITAIESACQKVRCCPSHPVMRERVEDAEIWIDGEFLKNPFKRLRSNNDCTFIKAASDEATFSNAFMVWTVCVCVSFVSVFRHYSWIWTITHLTPFSVPLCTMLFTAPGCAAGILELQ